jgi:hypothetical protein
MKRNDRIIEDNFLGENSGKQWIRKPEDQEQVFRNNKELYNETVRDCLGEMGLKTSLFFYYHAVSL